MKTEIINNRTVLSADEGKVITDGTGIYGVKIAFAVGVKPKGFYEISEAEAKAQSEEGIL